MRLASTSMNAGFKCHAPTVRAGTPAAALWIAWAHPASGGGRLWGREDHAETPSAATKERPASGGGVAGQENAHPRRYQVFRTKEGRQARGLLLGNLDQRRHADRGVAS